MAYIICKHNELNYLCFIVFDSISANKNVKLTKILRKTY